MGIARHAGTHPEPLPGGEFGGSKEKKPTLVREIQGADDPRADALGYTHAAPLWLLRPFIKVVM